MGQQLRLTAMVPAAMEADAFCGYDAMGYYYGIRDNVFFKGTDERVAEYKNVSLGRITRVDLLNPLRIVLFYGDFNAVVLLDNQLNEVQRIVFTDVAPELTVTAVGLAGQNRLWIYDSASLRIGLYDCLSGSYQLVTQPLNGILKTYGSSFNYFRWIDDKGDRYGCDLFGKIDFAGKVPDYEAAIFDGADLWFLKTDALYVLRGREPQPIKAAGIAEKSIKSFWVKDQILSIFTASGISHYKISFP